jgi:glutathione synthase/RimK-type ligase-like ATP-grasp enzyme
MKIALLTEHRFDAPSAPPGNRFFENVLLEDRLLGDALRARGITAQRVDWARPEVDWSTFQCAVFRTTWDYFSRFGEFTTWFDRVETQTRVLNVPDIIRWNMDKHYLADLEARGIPVVKSRYIEVGDTISLLDLLGETGWKNAILKPCVSGNAYHTYRVDRGTADEVDSAVRELRSNAALMLQPFQEDIARTGEDTLMVLNGRYTHAIRKKVKQGDFRVQDDHGGTVHPLEPTQDHIDLAERAMAACSPTPVYGRVDMVRNNEGTLAIMELELIEPELWLRFHPPAAEVMAEGIAAALATTAPGRPSS